MGRLVAVAVVVDVATAGLLGRWAEGDGVGRQCRRRGRGWSRCGSLFREISEGACRADRTDCGHAHLGLPLATYRQVQTNIQAVGPLFSCDRRVDHSDRRRSPPPRSGNSCLVVRRFFDIVNRIAYNLNLTLSCVAETRRARNP